MRLKRMSFTIGKLSLNCYNITTLNLNLQAFLKVFNPSKYFISLTNKILFFLLKSGLM